MKTRLEELNDLVKAAKWNATGGYDTWSRHDANKLSTKEKLAERDARVEAYVQLRIEKALGQIAMCLSIS